MKFRAVSPETRMNYMMWSLQQEIRKEEKYLASLDYDPSPIMKIVKARIDAWDPVHFIEMDGQDDEYDTESRSITIYVTKHLDALDETALAQAIDRIITKAFLDLYVPSGESLEVAGHIIADLKQSKEVRA
ncbi:hypothetical protein [Paenibacillus roseipurpureus]|uniref:Uncharacterized protein n=1 Tax=Paenibacillus roseopurpureus TaxID=2918901 RepID=A0AA96LR78_9BACL|nr:hypothetical protein [Paenibacillus sp. MBLB1832]WNR46772.1 hypothetical protein MJB10_11970 [Paenibacillus sp. MBLB1832]